MELLELIPAEPVAAAPRPETACTAELAECTCPDSFGDELEHLPA